MSILELILVFSAGCFFGVSLFSILNKEKISASVLGGRFLIAELKKIRTTLERLYEGVLSEDELTAYATELFVDLIDQLMNHCDGAHTLRAVQIFERLNDLDTNKEQGLNVGRVNEVIDELQARAIHILSRNKNRLKMTKSEIVGLVSSSFKEFRK